MQRRLARLAPGGDVVGDRHRPEPLTLRIPDRRNRHADRALAPGLEPHDVLLVAGGLAVQRKRERARLRSDDLALVDRQHLEVVAPSALAAAGARRPGSRRTRRPPG